MVIDSSALIAILLGEPGSDDLVRTIARAGERMVGAPTWVEASAVMRARKGPGGELALDALMERMTIQIVPLSVDAARLARLGYARFGKGIGDPAVLNYGDCLAYGTAMAAARPLLFVGDDFVHTDVDAAR
ncbi:MAG: type II toxin-antitoxin system VapC family toxin [Longimicrobiales bacterium]